MEREGGYDVEGVYLDIFISLYFPSCRVKGISVDLLYWYNLLSPRRTAKRVLCFHFVGASCTEGFGTIIHVG